MQSLVFLTCFLQKLSKKNFFFWEGGWLDPLGKGRVKNVANVAEPLKVLQMLQKALKNVANVSKA